MAITKGLAIIGDLALYNTEAAVRVYQNTSNIDTLINPALSFGSIIRGSFRLNEFTTDIGYVFDNSPSGDNGYLLRMASAASDKLEFIIWTSTGTELMTNTYSISEGEVVSYEIIITSGNIEFTVNGNTENKAISGTPLASVTGNLVLGNEFDGLGGDLMHDFYTFEIVGVVKYDTTSYYGSLDLPDLSGNGNDGTLNNVLWWKKGVDAVYATPQLAKSDIGTQTGDLTLKYTDATPYYASDNTFWTHNKATYVFTVIAAIDESHKTCELGQKYRVVGSVVGPYRGFEDGKTTPNVDFETNYEFNTPSTYILNDNGSLTFGRDNEEIGRDFLSLTSQNASVATQVWEWSDFKKVYLRYSYKPDVVSQKAHYVYLDNDRNGGPRTAQFEAGYQHSVEKIFLKVGSSSASGTHIYGGEIANIELTITVNSYAGSAANITAIMKDDYDTLEVTGTVDLLLIWLFFTNEPLSSGGSTEYMCTLHEAYYVGTYFEETCFGTSYGKIKNPNELSFNNLLSFNRRPEEGTVAIFEIRAAQDVVFDGGEFVNPKGRATSTAILCQADGTSGNVVIELDGPAGPIQTTISILPGQVQLFNPIRIIEAGTTATNLQLVWDR